MRSFRYRPYASVVWIAAMVVLLLGLLSYFTWANYRRQQDLLADLLTREGRSLIRAMEAGARAEIERPSWGIPHFQRLIDELTRSVDVAGVAVHNRAGGVTLSAGEPPALSMDQLQALLADSLSQGITLPSGQAFAVADRFRPYAVGARHDLDATWQAWRDSSGFVDRFASVSISLSTRHFQEAQREDTRRAAGTAVLILLIGGAGFFVLTVLQRAQATQSALSEARGYARHVVDSISNGVFSVDRNGHVVSMNAMAGQILGVSPADAVGMFYRDLISEGPCRLEPTIQEGFQVLEEEITCRSLHGRSLEVVVSASQLRNDTGEVLGAVVVIRDLGDLHRLQDQLRRSERLASVGQMVAGVAHEFRNPLSTIKGFARYFQRKYSESPEDGEYADLITAEVDRLNRVIEDMLRFAQPLEPQRQSVDFGELVERARALCRTTIESKGLVVEYLGEPGQTLTADGDLLIQVLVNLIDNAGQAVGEGGHIGLELTRHRGRVVISVTDDGPGIGDIDSSRLFDPFFTTKSSGTGLGLSIVYSIVERHRGHIEVDSPPGQGACFRVILPQEED